MLSFILFALVLGVSAVGAGFKWYELSFLTTTNLAGGSEFTVVSLWNNPLNIPLIVAVGVTCNAKIFTPANGANNDYHNWGTSADGVLNR